MRRLLIGLLVGGATCASLAVSADESMTIFDQLHRLDATAVNEQRRATDVEAQLAAIDADLDERWSSVDVAQRAARPIRKDVTQGLARWLIVYRTAEREALDGPQAGADTRRLLSYAADRALPARLRDVDVVRRADAERAGFEGLMARRAQWGVELARTRANAGAASGARGVLIQDARTSGTSAGLATTNDEFEAKLAAFDGAGLDIDFHRFKGTLARPMTQLPEYHFGAQAPLMRPEGWTYRAERGDEIHAVHAGEVVFVGAAQGWGLVVVVEHGGGYTSVYGHLDRADVTVGARVERADVIAQAGESGSLDGARLYFELRRGGKPVDPAQWFLKH